MSITISSVNIPVCSFRGSSSEEEGKKVKDVSSQVKAVTDEFKETSDVLADGAQAVTESVGTLGTSAIGLWAIAKKPFDKVYKFFTKEVIDPQTKLPKIKQIFDDCGKPKINPETGEALTKVVRQADWKKIGIVGGVVAAGVTLLTVANKIKNDKAEKTEQTEKVEEKNIDTEA